MRGQVPRLRGRSVLQASQTSDQADAAAQEPVGATGQSAISDACGTTGKTPGGTGGRGLERTQRAADCQTNAQASARIDRVPAPEGSGGNQQCRRAGDSAGGGGAQDQRRQPQSQKAPRHGPSWPPCCERPAN